MFLFHIPADRAGSPSFFRKSGSDDPLFFRFLRYVCESISPPVYPISGQILYVSGRLSLQLTLQNILTEILLHLCQILEFTGIQSVSLMRLLLQIRHPPDQIPGLALQLMTYLEGAIGDGASKPAGIYYFRISSDDISAAVEDISSEALSEKLTEAINRFLDQLKKTDRVLFVKRYWFCKDIDDIAAETGLSRNYINVHLHRTREKLKNYLIKENYDVQGIV